MDIIWGIASYNRPDKQYMLNYLHGLGYPKEQILLSTQTTRDYEEYTRLFGDKATVIYREGENVGDNKNSLLDYYCANYKDAHLVICSDKVKAVQYLGADKKTHKIEKREHLEAIVRKAFYLADYYGAELWGCYTTSNAFFMSHTTTINALLIGCFMGIVNPQRLRFDREQPIKEDFEVVLRTISQGGCVLRFNDICLAATFHSKGGSYELWHAEGDSVNKRCNDRLLARYQNLIAKHPTRANEQKYVGKSTKLNYSIINIKKQ